MHKFRELKVYQKSLDYIKKVYLLTQKFPKEEIFGLTSQIKRAVNSIALNIAEGSGSNSDREFNRFLGIALRSSFEVMGCLDIARKLEFCSEDEYQSYDEGINEISAMLSGLSKTLIT